MATAVATAVPAAEVKRRSGYLVGPVYDTVFFITSPLLAVIVGLAIARTPLETTSVRLFKDEGSPATILLGCFIMAHLVIVFFRSHANRTIFSTHRYRFTVVPAALFLAMTLSPWVQVAVAVLATFWDVYHSSLQTFGLGRIYDRLAGNDPNAGRRLDYLLNLLLYAGPILAGVSLMAHVDDFYSFRSVGSVLLSRIPAEVAAIHPWIAIGVMLVGGPFILYYILRYAVMAGEGYRVSPQKVGLVASTAFCSIYAWTFNPFGQAFFIMNFFHALQYFALVWHIEKGNIASTFRLTAEGRAKLIAFALFIGVAAVYGFFAEVLAHDGMLLSITLVVSIMHFWYDGFIWSVRKKQV
jgi:hypothetical protein